MINASHKSDEILITDDALSRYKVSCGTLYFWNTPSRMPSYFAQLFPQPKISGNPKRWRLSDLLAWEGNVGIKPEADQPTSQGDPAKQQASDADHPDNHAGCNVP